MSNRHGLWLGALVLVGLSAPVAAQNLGFLRNSALAAMSSEDKRAASAALREALDNAADGEVREWRNQQTQAAATFTLLRSYRDEQKGRDCREAQIELHADARSERSRNHLCRADDGSWKFAAPPRHAH